MGDYNFRGRLDDLRDEFPDYTFTVLRPAHVVIEISRFGAIIAKSAESSESVALEWAREVCATLPRIPAPSQSHDECRSRVRAFLRTLELLRPRDPEFAALLMEDARALGLIRDANEVRDE